MLWPRVRHGSVGSDHEVAAKLTDVAPETADPVPRPQQLDVLAPDLRVQPNSRRGRTPQTPRPVGNTVGVDEHRERAVDAVEHHRPDQREVVMDDEQRVCTGGDETIVVTDHLHEVGAADQSPGVTQERHEHHGTTQRQQVDQVPTKAWQGERRRGFAHSGHHHAASTRSTNARLVGVPPAGFARDVGLDVALTPEDLLATSSPTFNDPL